MTSVLRVLSVLIVASLVACVPTRYSMPALAGLVMSAQDDGPVAAAVVTDACTERQATTGDDGTFLLPEKKVWGVVEIPGHLVPRIICISVHANGYKPFELSPAHVQKTGGNRLEVKEQIRLEPAVQ